MNPKVKKGLKISAITLGSILGVAIIAIGSYAGYVFGSYYRIEDNQILEVNKRSNITPVKTNKELSYTSFNIGFGAYSQNYDFFLDQGINADGTLQTGHYSKGFSKEEVMKNVTNCVELMDELNSDFYAIQEVDTDGTRSYHINQKDIIENKFNTYDSTFAYNFHSPYLAYPLYDMHGKNDAGIVTLSKYQIESSIRKSLTISDGFDKLFDLDRCFSANYINIEGSKKLCLVNIHMSAYDEGGYIRNTQVQEINSFINTEYDKGNYVIVAGDFNHDLLTNNPDYSYTPESPAYKEQYTQLVPPWVSRLFNDDKTCPFKDHFKVVAADNCPSVRGVDRGYQYGYTYVNTVDGFIVSDNVEVVNVKTTPTNGPEMNDMFKWCDHQPTTLKFKLK